MVIIWDNMFFVVIFNFLVSLRFKFKFFNPERVEGLKT